MAPIMTPSFQTTEATLTLHQLVRRGEEGRIAGMLIGCLVGGIAAASLIYFCFNCVFSPKRRKKTAHQRQQAHPHKHHIHYEHPLTRTGSGAHMQSSGHPHTHRWTHHHHHRRHRKSRLHHHHHHHAKGKAKPKKHCRKPNRKTKASKPARHSKRSSQHREPAIRFMPMPPMMAMPIHPAPAAGMGMGMGMGMAAGIVMPLGDGFIDYGPAPGQDMGLEMGCGVDPNFRLEQFVMENDVNGDREVSCNECCYSFFDSLCGIPPEARDLKRDAAGNEAVIMGDNEMAAV
ncbi:hypothetical protein CORC01_08184 [Colletotrichum orchidophilum]|uniref:EF-hand domain-containing protein n=1 Tax=Colletotrichum orchidophilum TaxID=1209926 RepID=A0A1G4B5I4_9PEZI|nr:uncharacterized protein CORC01_08184 [Colletotrichum orchidophilum]OHE96586.1 hypothetical protein CORC01_08184 [Colletotrichum orchidophilum]